MILASSSLSSPGLTWTSTPRSLKMATAAGDSLSEIRTRGVISDSLVLAGGGRAARAGGGGGWEKRRPWPALTPGRGGAAVKQANRTERGGRAAFASLLFSSTKA